MKSAIGTILSSLWLPVLVLVISVVRLGIDGFGTGHRMQIAALVGVAPMNRDGGITRAGEPSPGGGLESGLSSTGEHWRPAGTTR